MNKDWKCSPCSTLTIFCTVTNYQIMKLMHCSEVDRLRRLHYINYEYWMIYTTNNTKLIYPILVQEIDIFYPYHLKYYNKCTCLLKSTVDIYNLNILLNLAYFICV